MRALSVLSFPVLFSLKIYVYKPQNTKDNNNITTTKNKRLIVGAVVSRQLSREREYRSNKTKKSEKDRERERERKTLIWLIREKKTK